MNAIQAGLTLLIAGSARGFPRTAGRKHFKVPFRQDGPPHYPRVSNGTVLREHIQGKGVAIDVSLLINFAETARERGKSIPVKAKMKTQRLLLCIQYYMGMGATKVVPVFDPYTVDPDAPKDDKRWWVSLRDRMRRGTPAFYQPGGPHRNRRGEEFEAVTEAQKAACDRMGIKWIQAAVGEAELQATFLTRDPSFGIDVVLGGDDKDVICVGMAECLVDARAVGGAVSQAYIYKTAEASQYLGLRRETLIIMQILAGDDAERGHDCVYNAAIDPYYACREAALYLETLISAGFPDALSVLIGRVKGLVAFSPQADLFWGSFIGRDNTLHTGGGQAKRAYALEILMAYQRFARDGPSRGMTLAIQTKVRNAGLPTKSAAEICAFATSDEFPKLPKK